MLLWQSPSFVLSLLCYSPPLLTFALKALPIFTVGVCKSGEAAPVPPVASVAPAWHHHLLHGRLPRFMVLHVAQRKP